MIKYRCLSDSFDLDLSIGIEERTDLNKGHRWIMGPEDFAIPPPNFPEPGAVFIGVSDQDSEVHYVIGSTADYMECCHDILQDLVELFDQPDARLYRAPTITRSSLASNPHQGPVRRGQRDMGIAEWSCQGFGVCNTHQLEFSLRTITWPLRSE